MSPMKKRILWFVVFCLLSPLPLFVHNPHTVAVGRARQSEAKIALGQIVQAEKEFHKENGRYTSCLDKLGLNLDLHDYLVGFSQDCAEGGPAVHQRKKGVCCGPVEPPVSALEGAVVTPTGFKAKAVGYILPGGPHLDIWSMSENMELVHEQNGLGSEWSQNLRTTVFAIGFFSTLPAFLLFLRIVAELFAMGIRRVLGIKLQKRQNT